MIKQLFLKNEQATLDLGSLFATLTPKNFIIYLYGEPGAGKTTFVRGFLRGMGYQHTVKSPTYTLVETYQLQKKKVHHFDFYRIVDPEEIELIGIRDYFADSAICLVEWPEKVEGQLPTADLSCYITVEKSGRNITLKSSTKKGHVLLDKPGINK